MIKMMRIFDYNQHLAKSIDEIQARNYLDLEKLERLHKLQPKNKHVATSLELTKARIKIYEEKAAAAYRDLEEARTIWFNWRRFAKGEPI